MTPETFRDACEILHGERYAIPMADALGVSDRTVRRWAAGTAPIPSGVAGELAAIVETRRDDLAAILRELRDAARHAA